MNRDLEHNTAYSNKPAYRYIRMSDRLPTYDEMCAAKEAGQPPQALVKLFDPTGSWTWYIAAYDPETRTAWGACQRF